MTKVASVKWRGGEAVMARLAWSLGLVLALAGCDGPEVETTVKEVAVAPLERKPPRRAKVVVPETFERLDLLVDLQERVLELELEIAEFNQNYSDINFENFLGLDPWALTTDQVYFLKHFCDNGDFTLRSEAEAVLVERELTRRRNASVEFDSGERLPLHDRLDVAISRYEQRVADLEKIVGMFRNAAGETIEYPSEVEPEVLQREREYVLRKQEEIRGELEKWDGVIEALRDALEEVNKSLAR